MRSFEIYRKGKMHPQKQIFAFNKFLWFIIQMNIAFNKFVYIYACNSLHRIIHKNVDNVRLALKHNLYQQHFNFLL